MKHTHELRLEIDQYPQFFITRVIVPGAWIDSLYKEIVSAQREDSHIHGFVRGTTPKGYIDLAYRTHIIDHLEEFIYKYLVIGFLYQSLHDKKMHFAGEPRITNIEMAPEKDAVFTFQCTMPESLALRGWKFYSFRSPKRKNYRDLDRQVEQFLKTEEELTQAYKNPSININDWICFDVCVVDSNKNPLISTAQTLWLRIGNEEVDVPFQELFCGKKVGDQFYSSAFCLQEHFSSQLDTRYLFSITIKDLVPDQLFSFEDFKTNFRLRTNKEIHKKLIEVFSYRNDVSQRRETIEEVFRLLLAQHEVEALPHLVLRKQELLITAVQDNPDYQVYRMQRDFEDKMRLLAEKQIKEIILIDQLSIKENISISHQDIKHYLNLIKRPRTKEFVYFDLPPTRVNGQEVPIATELLKQYSLREKTLNYVIYHLTRK